MLIRHSLMFLSYAVLLNTRQCVILFFGCLYSLHQSRYFGEPMSFLMFYFIVYFANRDAVRHGLFAGQNAHGY